VDQPSPENPQPEAALPSDSPEEVAEAAPAEARGMETALPSMPLEVIQTAAPSPALLTPALGSPAGLAQASTFSNNTKGVGGNGTSQGLRTMASVFGSKGEASDALVGYFYDLKQTADGSPSDMALNPTEISKGLTPGWQNYSETRKYEEVVQKFLRNWDESILKHYFRAPEPLSTYQVFFPKMLADAAPKAFDVDKQVKPSRWLVHYKGTVISPVTGQIRFVGFGDDILFVRFNRKGVLEASFKPMGTDFNGGNKEGVGAEYAAGRQLATGAWMRVTEGESYPIEILVGESPGGDFRCFLLVQEKGKDYANRAKGGPQLPVFQTAPTQLPSYQVEKTGPPVAPEAFIFKVPSSNSP